MDKTKNIKLIDLSESEMNEIKAGSEPYSCYCVCRYEDSGGSSLITNAGANDEGGYWSP